MCRSLLFLNQWLKEHEYNVSNVWSSITVSSTPCVVLCRRTLEKTNYAFLYDTYFVVFNTVNDFCVWMAFGVGERTLLYYFINYRSRFFKGYNN